MPLIPRNGLLEQRDELNQRPGSTTPNQHPQEQQGTLCSARQTPRRARAIHGRRFGAGQSRACATAERARSQ
eukprot:13737720-Alexandrium_andersonii.AAC.1